MSEPVCIEVKLTADCPACQQPTPLHGLVRQQPCATCLSALALDNDGWRQVFTPQAVADLVRRTEVRWRERVSAGALRIRAELSRKSAVCGACERPVDPHRLAEAAGRGRLLCDCGHRIRVRRADALAAGLLPGAGYLIGEELVDTALENSEPLSITCAGCGGSLPVDRRSQRTVSCTYCEASNFLPDNLWFRIRPRPVTRPFFVYADLSEGDNLRVLAGDARHAPLIAGRADAPADVLAQLSAHPDAAVRGILAENRSLPEAAAVVLAQDEDEAVRAALAGNPSAGGVLSSLAADPAEAVRGAAAANPAAAVEVLVALAADPAPAVRRRLLDNPRAPLEALTSLAENEASDAVLSALSRSLPEPVLRALAGSPHPAARRVAAQHPDTPLDCLRALAGDAAVAPVLYQRASLPPELLAGAASSPDAAVRRRVAGHPGLPEIAVVTLAGDNDLDVALAVSRRTGLSGPALSVLATCRHRDARRVVAAAERLPEEAAVSLAKTGDYQTRAALLDRPTLPEAAMLAIATDKRMDLRKRLARHASFPSSPAALGILNRDRDRHLQGLLARHPAHAALERRRRLLRIAAGVGVLAVLGGGVVAVLGVAAAMGWLPLG